MKKSVKYLAVAGAVLTMATAALGTTAFAASADSNTSVSASASASTSNVTYFENHSKIDCTNRYKMNDGKYNFTIKTPKRVSANDVKVNLTSNSEGTASYGTYALSDLNATKINEDETNNYYQLILDKPNGVGVKLYCVENSGSYMASYYMATDNTNVQTTEGRGYWLGA